MENFHITNELTKKQIYQLFKLSKQMWWCNNRTLFETAKMVEKSLSFGLIENKTDNLVGYARILTDEIKYAFIFDVMVDKNHRRKGLSRKIIDAIFAHDKLSRVTNFDLTCAPDMIEYYKKFNFSDNFGTLKVLRCVKKTCKSSNKS